MGCKQSSRTEQLKELTVIDLSLKQDSSFTSFYLPTNIQITENGMTKTYLGSTKIRGGFSISFPKSSYELDFEKDISINQLAADDDWILNANYIDKTFLRHVIAYRLFQKMSQSNIAPNTQFVEVNRNGEYHGLYVLMEKIDRSTLNIKKKDTSAYIFKDPHLFKPIYSIEQGANYNQQTFPKFIDSDKSHVIDRIRSFILNTNNSDFEHQFPTYFNLDNIVDWHILLLVTGNSDGVLKNFYLYKNKDLIGAQIAPWDYDHSFGRDGDNEPHKFNQDIQIERSILFKRLISCHWYIKDLKASWTEYRRTFLADEKLYQMINDEVKFIKNHADRNFRKWPIDAKEYYDDNSFESEIDLFKTHAKDRLNWLDEYVKTL